MKRLISIGSVLLLVLGLAAVARAQILTGSIIGTIKDESGAVLPGVTVTLTSPAHPSGPATFVTSETGEYRFTRFRSSPLATAPKRRLSGSAAVVFGNYWNGTAEQITTGITYKVPPWFTASFNTNTTWAHLPQGEFVARIVTANIDYSASPMLSFSNLVQYDNRSRNLGWQSRMRWTQRPGNDLFISFNQGWIREDGESDSLRFHAQDAKLAAKFQYSFRF